MKSYVSVLLATAVLGAAVLSAQTNRGSLTGTVTDITRAVVPEAQVTVANAQTGTRYQAQTSAGGVYTVSELPFGSYSVSVSKTGFRAAQVKEITITVNQVTRLDVTLQVGEVHQSVEVTERAVALQQDTATVQTTYNRKFMSELPLALGTFSLRAPESFMFLTPGVVGSTWNATINGGQTFANEVLLDGASTGRTWHPGNFDESAPSVDALGEFSIKTNAFSAEYGRTGSAVTSFAYKSGTNDPHGSLYYFLRNEALDARGFYRQNTSDRKHDFGGTFGGPIYLPKLYNGRNRSFFFVSFEAFLTDRPYTASPQVVPTELQRQGDFSELLRLRDPVQIHHSGDGTPYAGNLIPRSQWSKVSSYALQFIPKANMVQPGTGLMRWYSVGVPTTLRNNLETVVLDHNFTESQRFHYSWSRRNNHRFRDPENLLPIDDPLTRMRDQTYTTNQWRA
ncbi:MAG: carboxypeptidase-like regulatory domain-containing protein, partial [Acidobacteriota bacterium]